MSQDRLEFSVGCCQVSQFVDEQLTFRPGIGGCVLDIESHLGCICIDVVAKGGDLAARIRQSLFEEHDAGIEPAHVALHLTAARSSGYLGAAKFIHLSGQGFNDLPEIAARNFFSAGKELMELACLAHLVEGYLLALV